MSEDDATKDVLARLGELRDVAAPTVRVPARPAPSGVALPRVGSRLKTQLDVFGAALATIVLNGKANPVLWWDVKTELSRAEPRQGKAMAIAKREMEKQRPAFDRLTAETWDELIRSTVEDIGSHKVTNPDIQAALLRRVAG